MNADCDHALEPLRLETHWMPYACGMAFIGLLGCGCMAPTSAPDPGSGETHIVGGKADNGNSAELTVFRFSELSVRAPHFYVRPLFTCKDVTDKGIFGKPSINEQLNASISGDDAEAPDGLLDLSLMLGFRPFDPHAVDGQIDFELGRCSAAPGAIDCERDPDVAPVSTLFANQTDGPCLAPQDDHLSGMSYESGPATITAPCFVTERAAVALRLGLVEFPLQDFEVAAAYAEGGLGHGLLRGFLREADADEQLLPEHMAVIGGRPVSFLLPGGSDNCAGHDERVMHDGEAGWWIYANFRATRIEHAAHGDTDDGGW
jgi:hypothetical protein